MSELRKMFAMVSGVGGVFSRDEMEEFMIEADKVIDHCKSFHRIIVLQDGNGKIDYEEFIKMLKQYD